MPTDVQISNHAIDTASLRVDTIWREDRSEDEGLYSWLARVCAEALANQTDRKRDRIAHKGCVFVFAYGNEYPTLKTVLCRRRR